MMGYPETMTDPSYAGQIIVLTYPLIRKLLKEFLNQKIEKPIFGICLGHQIMAKAAGAKTYKMTFGHRSYNQPCIEIKEKK